MDALKRVAGDRETPRIMGVVLAGGRSVRMGREKAFTPLAGRPLLAHVLARFSPQVACVVLNANGEPARFADFGLTVAPDAPFSDAGPLAGIAAGLRIAQARGYEWMATCPSDAPFQPADLVDRLLAGLGSSAVAMAKGPGGIEPLFGLWRVSALPEVESALKEGRFAVREVAARAGLAEVTFDVGPAPGCFANLNTPEDLAAAEKFVR